MPPPTPEKISTIFFTKVTLTVDNSMKTIQTIVPIMENCLASAGSCETEKGILCWNPKTYNACRLKLGENTVCLMTGKRLTCPQMNLAFTNISTVEICNMTLGTTEQGIYFTSSEPTKFNPTITHLDKVSQKLNSNRQRRSAPRVVLDNELNARFQF